MIYKAFVSYSHAADGKLAPAIQSALQSFAKPWYRLRAFRVFRDKTTLAMTPQLWPSIQAALDESEFFLLLASVESRRSIWVEREIEYWLRNRPADRLLIIVTGSSPVTPEDAAIDFAWIRENLLPECLQNGLSEEPLYLDLRWLKTQQQLSARNPRFLEEIAGLSSALTGIPKDVLTGEDVKQHRRVRRLAWSAVTLLAVLTVASLAAALLAIRQMNITRARGLVAASRASEDIDPEISVLVATEGLAATLQWDRAHLPDAEQQIHRAILSSSLRLELLDPDAVNSVAWSPEGRRLATGTSGNLVRICDVSSGKELLTLAGHTGVVRSVAWSPDGKWVASGSDDKTARLWDAETGKPVLTLSGHDGSVDSVAWSSDSLRLATGSWDKTVGVWEAATGRLLLRLTADRIRVLAVAWSPDSKWLATGGVDQAAKIWDATSGEGLQTFGRNTGLLDLVSGGAVVESLAWSPDGTSLAVGSQDKSAAIWDVESGREKLRLRGHQSAVSSVAWSPDGRMLATGSADHTIRIWDRSGKELEVLRGHRNPVLSLAWSPDGKWLATASSDKTTRIWDTAGPTEVLMFRPDDDIPVQSVVWSPDGKELATLLEDQGPKLWDSATGKELPLPLPPEQPFLPPDSPSPVPTNYVHFNTISSMAWSPDGKRLAFVGDLGTAVVWDPDNGKELPLTPFDRGDVDLGDATCVAWNSDGSRLATGSWDKNTPRVWNAQTGEEVLALKGHSGRVYTLAWSPDGKRIATGSHDKTTRVWNAQDGRELQSFVYDENINSVAWSPDGTMIATGGDDKTVRVWNPETGKELFRLTGHTDSVMSVAWSHDGKWLATGGQDDTVRVWDAHTGTELLTLTGQLDSILSVDWSPDSKRLAAACECGTVQVYATDIHDLLELAGKRVTPHPSEESCRKYLQSEKCPPIPQLSRP